LSQAHRGAGMKIHMSTSMASAMEKYIVFIQDCGDHGIRMLERSHCMIIAFAAMPVDASNHVGRQVRVHGSSKIRFPFHIPPPSTGHACSVWPWPAALRS
jgi:hypothetical protein